MHSDPPQEAFVWIYLPGSTTPVVAGRLYREGTRFFFNYGRSYLANARAMALYEPELPLRNGAQTPLAGLTMPSCIRDASPDAWGRRVILNRLLGYKRDAIDVDMLDELSYLLESGSDRMGALDFQRSPSVYEPRGANAATLDELSSVAAKIENGILITSELEQALFRGSSLGGARPKALIDGGTRKYIAKFSSQKDTHNIVKAEHVAMRLARLAGLDVAHTELATAADKDVLLVERFDREKTDGGWTRKAFVSALTLFELDEMMARYASYTQLADIVRHRFADPRVTLRELYGRLVFNVLCGNTDDHARNHAAFWDGTRLRLTPAYDISPQPRTGREATQAMTITETDSHSTLAVCLAAAPSFLLTQADAERLIEAQVEAIRAHWTQTCDAAALPQTDRRLLWRRAFLNPFAFEGLPDRLTHLGAA